MFSGVIAAGYVWYSGFQVLVGQCLNSGSILTCVACNAVKAPGTAQVQTIEVYEFPIGTVFYLSGLQDGDGVLEQSRHESV